MVSVNSWLKFIINTKTVVQNKTARALSDLPDVKLKQAGLSRDKLSRGSEAYPWNLPLVNASDENWSNWFKRLFIERLHLNLNLSLSFRYQVLQV